MASYTIDKFTYGGNTYNLEDANTPLLVSFYFDINQDQWFIENDITYSDIANAIDNDKPIIARADNIGTSLNVSYVGPNTIGVSFDDLSVGYTSYLYINSSNVITSDSIHVGVSNFDNDAGYVTSDSKVNVSLATTTKAYLLGTSTTPTSTAQPVTSIADTGVYLDTTAGRLTATSFNGSGATLSSLNGSNISSGTIPAARINGAAITSFNASNISTGTLATARLNTSGVSAGSYGPSTDADPGAGANFSVPYLTVDTYGRVTAASTKNITMPESSNIEIYSGTTEPTSSIGANGDLYILVEGNSAGSLVYYNSTTHKMQTASGTEVSALTYDVITSW